MKLIVAFVASDPDVALAEAERLLGSPDAARRTLGADILGRMVYPKSFLIERVGNILIPRVRVEADPSALQAAIAALGQTYDERARAAVVSRASFDDADVRMTVAWALPSFGLDDAALAALRELSRDSDEDVRDWATFGLGQSEATDAATVEALFARTDDPNYDTRCEAILGLAMRHDPRARSLVDRELAAANGRSADRGSTGPARTRSSPISIERQPREGKPMGPMLFTGLACLGRRSPWAC